MTARRPETLPLRVLQRVRERALWRPGMRVAVAVSGGCDSTVLLHVLRRTQAAHGARLEVVSFDHGLRPEAGAEVAQVERFAAALGLPFRAEALALAPGPGAMLRAREARRQALLGLGADRIATGHHRDDQAETVLQRLLRGAGLGGMAAMAPRAGPWVRPLLDEPKAALVAYARANRLSWVEDPSNPGSERGRLRPLLAQLEAIRPGAKSAMARSAALLADDAALLQALADDAWGRCAREGGLDLAAVRAEPRPLARRVLLRLVAQAPAHPRADRVEAVLSATFSGEGTVELGEGWALVVSGGVVSLAPPRGAGPRGYST